MTSAEGTLTRDQIVTVAQGPVRPDSHQATSCVGASEFTTVPALSEGAHRIIAECPTQGDP